jgi:hypothetical protein
VSYFRLGIIYQLTCIQISIHNYDVFLILHKGKCIDEYIRLRTELAESKDPGSIKIDERLEFIVLGMFDKCFANKKFKQALGIALDTRRLDKIEQAISGADDVTSMLSYCGKLAMDIVLNREFRQKVNTSLDIVFVSKFN